MLRRARSFSFFLFEWLWVVLIKRGGMVKMVDMQTELDPMDIHAMSQSAQEHQKEALKGEELEVDDLKWLMSNRRGRRIVFRELDSAGVWRISFNTNALQMAFNEGARNAGLRLVNLVTAHCPSNFMKMMEENHG